MSGPKVHIIATDPDTGEVVWHCPGPNKIGACRRIAIGEEVPCVGRVLVLVGTPDEPYVVPRHMSLCPLLLAESLGVTMGRSAELPPELVA